MLVDTKFISKPVDGKQYKTDDFIGIANEDWTIDKVAELIGTRRSPPEDDKYPAGTIVEFTTPDNTLYSGKVASKSGDDYIIDVKDGESYLVPFDKLTKIDLCENKIREATRNTITPTLEKVSEHEEVGRLIVHVAYREKRPTDGQLMNWSSVHYPEIRLVDAIPKDGRSVDLIFELPKQAAEDVRPQGSAPYRPGDRGRPLSSEEIEGTGVLAEPIDDVVKNTVIKLEDLVEPQSIGMEEIVENPTEKPTEKEFKLADMVEKEAQLGQPGSAEQYTDLDRVAHWILARFNDSNPNYYATPQETEAVGEEDNKIVRLYFTLNTKSGEKLDNLYITRHGTITSDPTNEAKIARGFIQVDSSGNLPMVMISGPTGPESIQEYGFNLTAQADMCAAIADEVLNTHGGYSATAQTDFEARLTKLAVDPTAKKYWQGYFKDYGKMWTRDVPRKKHEASRKVAEVDEMTRKYWAEYFASGMFEDRWYGEQLTKSIPRKIYEGSGEITDSDQEIDSTDNSGIYYKNAQAAPGVKLYQAPTKAAPPPRTRKTKDQSVLEQIWKKHEVPKKQEQAVDAQQLAEYALAHAKTNQKVRGIIDQTVFTFAQKYPGIKHKAIEDLAAGNPQKYQNIEQSLQKWEFDPDVKAYILTYALGYDQNLYKNLYDVLTPSEEWKTKSPYEITAYIKKEKGEYCVKSEGNPDWSGGCYDSKEKAKKRLQQVEFFKHKSMIECPDVQPKDILDMVSYSLVMNDDPWGIYRRFASLIDRNQKKLAQRGIGGTDLQETVRSAVQLAEENKWLRNELDRLMYDFLRRNPDVKYEVLQKMDKKHVDPEAAAQILYLASQDKRYFSQLKKLVQKYEKEEHKKFWKGLSEEREKLKPGIMQKGKEFLKKVVPTTPTPAPVTPTVPEEGGPSLAEMEEYKPSMAVGEPSVPPKEEESKVEESKVEEPKIEEPKVTPEVEQAKPVVTPKPKVQEEAYKTFGPREERKPREIPTERPKLTKEQTKELEGIAKEFLKKDSPLAEQMKSILNYVPYPTPETEEQKKQYKEKGRPKYMGMTIRDIADNDPVYAYQFLVPHLNSISNVAGQILITYLKGKGVFEGILEGKKAPHKPKEIKEPKVKDVEKTKPKTTEFKETSVDDWTFPSGPLKEVEISTIIKHVWDRPEQLNKVLSEIAGNPEFSKVFIQWAQEALPEADAKRLIQTVEKKQPKSGEEAGVGTGTEPKSIEGWKIPENEEVPAFVGMTISEALKKNKNATINYMREFQPDKWLAYVKMVYPDEYMYELEKIESEEPKRKVGGVMEKVSKAGPGPHAYNAPGKDDKKDYDYKERNKQPARSRNRFQINRMYSTSSSTDSGYIIMEISWNPELFADISPQNIQHQLISFIKGLESMRQFHDFGIMGRALITEFDADAGVARVKVRCSQTKGIITLSYSETDPESEKVPLIGLR